MLKLSVIIPVYNMQKWLSCCLKSLINQDYDNYEIICVNDGSKDDSLLILKEYQSKYPALFKIIDQTNQGHSKARQNGFDIATGQYVWFVDADDMVDLKSVPAIIKYMDDNHCEFLTIGYVPIPDGTEYEFVQDCARNIVLAETSQSRRNACSGNRLFLREMLINNNISWDSRLSPNDDTVFLYYVTIYAKNQLIVKGANYYHRQSPTSVSHTKSNAHTRRTIESFMIMGEIYEKELSKPHTAEVLENTRQRLVLTTKSILSFASLSYTKEEQFELLKRLKERGWYPYKSISFQLTYKANLKVLIMDWLQYFFPCEWFYKLYCSLIRKFGLVRKN